jgi:hypothetical protein
MSPINFNSHRGLRRSSQQAIATRKGQTCGNQHRARDTDEIRPGPNPSRSPSRQGAPAIWPHAAGAFAIKTCVTEITVGQIISDDREHHWRVGIRARKGLNPLEMTLTIRQQHSSRAPAVAVPTRGLAIASADRPAMAEELSTQQILDGLEVSNSCSLSAPEQPSQNTDDLAFVNRVRGKSRSLSTDDREHRA